MPGIAHEAPIELLRRNPLLAAALLHGTGVTVPAEASPVLAAADLGSALPAELRADAVIVFDSPPGPLPQPSSPQPGAPRPGRRSRLVVVV